MLRFLTAGESHGRALTGILEGLPAGLPVEPEYVNLQLRRRQAGYGRGGRMRIEHDEIEITAGVRHGKTLGSPVGFLIRNRDWDRWQTAMSATPVGAEADTRPVTRPRPGHADLAGALKFQTYDARDILERASARETAARVAGGALCRLLLEQFGMRIGSHVLAVGSERVAEECLRLDSGAVLGLDAIDPLRCADPEAARRMIALIDQAKKAGDTLGGIIEVVAAGVPPGLGTYAQWDRRLDGRIAQALMSIPAVKAVEIGEGIAGAAAPGSAFHDEIFYDASNRRFGRKTNRAGGLEAGVTNGEDVRARLYLKPIPTLRRPLASADLRTKEAFAAAFERSDTCVVPAAGVIAEAMLAFVLADAFLEKFGGDSLAETGAAFRRYTDALREY